MDEIQLQREYQQHCSYHVNPPSFETWKKNREPNTFPSEITSIRQTDRPSNEPSTHEMIVAIRDALGLFSGAMPSSPKEVWGDTLVIASKLRRESQRYNLLRNAAKMSHGEIYVASTVNEGQTFSRPYVLKGIELDHACDRLLDEERS